MRRYFLTGLALLAPLALTLIVALFAIKFLTTPFLGIVDSFMRTVGLFNSAFLWMSPETVRLLISRIFILLFLFFTTVLLGFLARWVVVHYLIRAGDFVLHRIPLFNLLYKTFQDVVTTVFTSSSSSFKQVVLAPFPNSSTYSVGLLTNEAVPGGLSEKRAAVFIPTTPNPTSGFMILFKESDLIYLDLSVENAMKYIISCGVIMMPFEAISQEEAKRRIEELVKEEA